MPATLTYRPLTPQNPAENLRANPRRYARYVELHLCWDEENRLVSFADCENADFYQYDANGERTYKLTGGIAMQNIQGHWRSYNLLDNPTLYTSPYLVSTPKGYTKHYYAESERIASRIGGGGLGDITRTIMNMEDLLTDFWVGEDGLLWEEVWGSEFYETKLEGSRNHLTGVMMCAGADPLVEDNRLVELRTYWQYIQDEGEQECYWYHPDHLGSSSWITEKSGYSAQHLHYMPWGEDFVNQRTTDYAARFTFSAKEKDKETGFSYFGSRYYNSDLSIWLSVDPMSDKYPSMSPYVYCANNPVKLVDPNGESIVIQGENGEQHTFTPGQQCNSTDKNVQAAWNNLNKIYDTKAGKTVLNEMTKDGSPTFTFTNESLTNDGTARFQKDGNKGGTMYMGGKLNEGNYLAHELFHGYQELNGQGDLSIHNEVEANLFSMLTVGGGFELSHKNDFNFKTSYAKATKMFMMGKVNDFDHQFNILVNGFKDCSIANIPPEGKSKGIYQDFKLGIGTPSLIKQFFQ